MIESSYCQCCRNFQDSCISFFEWWQFGITCYVLMFLPSCSHVFYGNLASLLTSTNQYRLNSSLCEWFWECKQIWVVNLCLLLDFLVRFKISLRSSIFGKNQTAAFRTGLENQSWRKGAILPLVAASEQEVDCRETARKGFSAWWPLQALWPRFWNS
jgi:hypothetical protein